MPSLTVRAYTSEDADAWDHFCAHSINGTFLHTRRFLGYHGDRFRDRSCIVEDGNGWLGVLPAAEQPGQADWVVSHPGVTYGGLLHQGRLFGDHMLTALAAIADHYREAGYRRFRYKAIPHIYQRCPAQDDLYALFRLGGERYRCDLSSTIDLLWRRPVAERRRRGMRKAQKAGVEVLADNTLLPQFWEVLEENLALRHDTRPVHTLTEMQELVSRFPHNIALVCACLDAQVVAGTLLFLTDCVHHAQYIASSRTGQNLSALDAVFDHCIGLKTPSVRHFDFGISTEADGRMLNDGLYCFKTEFGGGGVVSEFYELDLTTMPAIAPETA